MCHTLASDLADSGLAPLSCLVSDESDPGGGTRDGGGGALSGLAPVSIRDPAVTGLVIRLSQVPPPPKFILAPFPVINTRFCAGLAVLGRRRDVGGRGVICGACVGV